MLACFADRGHDLASTLYSEALQSKCLSQLRKIGTEQRSCRIAAVIEELLPLPHHSQISVVNYRDVQIESLLRCRRQLGHRHLEAAIARDHPYFRFGSGKLRADCGWKGEAHGSESA